MQPIISRSRALKQPKQAYIGTNFENTGARDRGKTSILARGPGQYDHSRLVA